MNTRESNINAVAYLQLADGNESAFREIFHHFYPRLEAYVLKVTRDPQVTEEIVQDVLLTVWLKHEEFHEIREPESWIFKVATNRTYDYLKKLARQRKLMSTLLSRVPVPEMDTENRVQLRESTSLLHSAVRQLPEQQQLVYRLNRENGLRTDEIAKQLAISQSTVKNHLVRALRSVRQFMLEAARVFLF